MDTFSKHEKRQSEDKTKDSFDRNTHDSKKFDPNSHNYSERLGSHTKNLSDKKYSVKTDTNDSDYKKIKRERQIKSPPMVKSEFDDGMNLNSFSSRTIEESMSSKQAFIDNRFDSDSNSNKFYKMNYNPVTKSSNKQVKAAFKMYNKNDNIIAQKYKNISNEGDKSMISKKRNSISGNSSVLNTSSKNLNKIAKLERSKMRSISSASSIKTFQSIQKNIGSIERQPKIKTVKEYEIKGKEIYVLIVIKIDQLHNPVDINESLSSIYSTIEENSVCNKRHDISVVEADGILDQINSRMMKFYFETILLKGGSDLNLGNKDQQEDDFSFEIDNTNNMVVPKNSSNPIKDKKFVQLPHREDLYNENELSNGNIQWVADTKTVRIFPQSPNRNQNASVTSPFTSPQTNPRSPGSIVSPTTGNRDSNSKHTVKQSMYSFQHSSNHYYEQNRIVETQKHKNEKEFVVRDFGGKFKNLL